MIRKICLILLLLSGIAHSQDIVKLTSGAELNLKIVSNNPETIAYENEKGGFLYYIVKNEINEIVFQNGTIEKIEHPELALEQKKANVVRLVNDCALAEKSERKFKASFEGDYLRMIMLNKDNEDVNDGLLYDLAKVYKFDPISIRNGDHAYINIWTDRVRWPEKTGREKMDKIKFILRIYDLEKAALLYDAFIQLHKALPRPRY